MLEEWGFRLSQDSSAGVGPELGKSTYGKYKKFKKCMMDIKKKGKILSFVKSANWENIKNRENKLGLSCSKLKSA